jgi:uncharacterized membrane protein HdeD (DUF308 family)
MSDENNLVGQETQLVGVADLRKGWKGIVGFGVALIILGMIALGSPVLVTLGTMVMIGWLMIFAGTLQILHGFTNRATDGFFVDLLAGILSTVVGILIVGHPGATGGALTLMIAMLLLIGGCFRIFVAFSIRYLNGTWLLIHGILSIVLAVIILQDWPLSGQWVIGTFIGIDMIFNGWTLVMLGSAVRRLS